MFAKKNFYYWNKKQNKFKLDKAIKKVLLEEHLSPNFIETIYTVIEIEL